MRSILIFIGLVTISSIAISAPTPEIKLFVRHTHLENPGTVKVNWEAPSELSNCRLTTEPDIFESPVDNIGWIDLDFNHPKTSVLLTCTYPIENNERVQSPKQTIIVEQKSNVQYYSNEAWHWFEHFLIHFSYDNFAQHVLVKAYNHYANMVTSVGFKVSNLAVEHAHPGHGLAARKKKRQ